MVVALMRCSLSHRGFLIFSPKALRMPSVSTVRMVEFGGEQPFNSRGWPWGLSRCRRRIGRNYLTDVRAALPKAWIRVRRRTTRRPFSGRSPFATSA